jgi:nifR3 family TIM-barrel protein
VRPLELRPGTRLARNLILAPMAGVTNLPFRLIAREAGAALVFTETVSARGLTSGGARTWRLVESSPREQPLAYQLFGRDIAALGEATRMLADRGARFVDLNLGCPVKKFIRNGAGSALLREPGHVAKLVRAMRAGLPDGVISVKMRTGWDASSITAPEVARVAEAEGADFVSVHGRTRAQLYRGSASHEHIAAVVAAVRIPVFANGDVVTAEGALETLHRTGAAGVMIGRGAMSNPWIFSQVIEIAEGRPLPRPSREERAELIERHLGLMLGYFSERRSAVHMIKKYLCAYSQGLPGSVAFRDRVNRADELDGLIADGTQFFRQTA